MSRGPLAVSQTVIGLGGYPVPMHQASEQAFLWAALTALVLAERIGRVALVGVVSALAGVVLSCRA